MLKYMFLYYVHINIFYAYSVLCIFASTLELIINTPLHYWSSIYLSVYTFISKFHTFMFCLVFFRLENPFSKVISS